MRFHKNGRTSYRFVTLLLGVFATFFIFTASLDTVDADVWVNGYTRKDGTYVQGHYRSNPDGNPYNNWSFPGNTNPHTGEVAPGNPDTYLENYYSSPGSPSGSGGYALPTDSSYIGSTYRSVDGGYYYGSTLFCNYGYYQSGASCVKAPAHATAYGFTSFYCDRGYYRDGEQCRAVPEHAYALGESWQCYSGYIKQGEQCVAPALGSVLGGGLYCPTGYIARNNQCISHTEDCRLHFGDHVIGSAQVGGGSTCRCESGNYAWNDTQTACVQYSLAANSAAPSISLEDLQKQIQALLAAIAALQTQLTALAAR